MLATRHPPLATHHAPLATHHPPLAPRSSPLVTFSWTDFLSALADELFRDAVEADILSMAIDQLLDPMAMRLVPDAQHPHAPTQHQQHQRRLRLLRLPLQRMPHLAIHCHLQRGVVMQLAWPPAHHWLNLATALQLVAARGAMGGRNWHP